MVSEKDLISGCKHQCPAAQKELYLRYASVMKGICHRYIADREEVKDVLQEGFVKVFINIHQYSEKGSFEGWVKRIIINTAINHLRKKKTQHVEFAENLSLNAEDDEMFFDDSSLTEEELFHSLSLLPNDFRLVFNLFYMEDYSHKEIAEMLAIKEETSRTRLTRARKLLQKHLKELIRVKMGNTMKVKQ